MRYLPVRVWRDFQMAVMPLSEESSLREVLSVILSWIRGNCKCFEFEPFSEYGFDDFLHVKEDLMPVGYSSFLPGDINHFKDIVLKYRSKDVEGVARFLRDTLEALMTIEVEVECPNCEFGAMRVFIGRNKKILAYQCDVCGCSRYIDGSRVEINGLEFATEDDLRSFGLIS